MGTVAGRKKRREAQDRLLYVTCRWATGWEGTNYVKRPGMSYRSLRLSLACRLFPLRAMGRGAKYPLPEYRPIARLRMGNTSS